MDEIAIQVTDLSKKFDLPQRNVGNIIKRIAGLFSTNSKSLNNNSEEFYALHSMDFTINKGETICIIGENGSGKSTLLKVLSGVTYPTGGNVKINGKVASVLDIGTGFHPELSGRENIYLNGSLLGLKKHEIDTVFNDIVEFSEIGKFINIPVKHYSSGMNARLAFSIVVHVNADIILFDETLSVGDQAFKNKAVRKIKNLSNEGKTFIIVSHLISDALALGERTMLLEKGRLISFDLSYIVVQKYFDFVQEKSFKSFANASSMNNPLGNSVLKNLNFTSKNPALILDKILINGIEKFPVNSIFLRDEITFEFHYSKLQENIKSNIITMIMDSSHTTVYMATNLFCSNGILKGQYKTFFALPPYFLNEGLYSLYVILLDEFNPVVHIPSGLVTFKINHSEEDEKYKTFPKYPCPIYPEFNWKEELLQKF
jgi:lipopolysaccharide transport system ATP-binding protein